MPHQADRGLVDHLVEDHQILVLELVLGLAGLEVVVQVVFQLGLQVAMAQFWNLAGFLATELRNAVVFLFWWNREHSL